LLNLAGVWLSTRLWPSAASKRGDNIFMTTR